MAATKTPRAPMSLWENLLSYKPKSCRARRKMKHCVQGSACVTNEVVLVTAASDKSRRCYVLFLYGGRLPLCNSCAAVVLMVGISMPYAWPVWLTDV
eukprot:644096-Amphidinium_carterae.1